MSLLTDGGCADPGVEEEWEQAIQNVLKGDVDAKLQLKNN